MNLICIPFAYEENMNSGVNVSIKGKGKIEIGRCASYKLWQMEYS